MTDVVPHDTPILPNDEHRWRGKIIAQQVVHAVSLGDLMTGVSQQRVGGPGALLHTLHRRYRGDSQRDHLRSGILECFVISLQPNELRAVGPSATFLEKDQHYRPLAQLLR